MKILKNVGVKSMPDVKSNSFTSYNNLQYCFYKVLKFWENCFTGFDVAKKQTNFNWETLNWKY